MMKKYAVVMVVLLIVGFALRDAIADITMTFEEFLGIDQTPVGTYYFGVTFESGTGGSDWVARDATSGNYNVSSWPSGDSWSAGNYWIYDLVGATTALNYTGNDGVIRYALDIF